MKIQFNLIRSFSFNAILKLCDSLNIPLTKLPLHSDMLKSIVKAYECSNKIIQAEGVLDIVQDSYGFLRFASSSYCASQSDVYISPNMIKQFMLRQGDTICCIIRAPIDKEKYITAKSITHINYIDIDKYNPHAISYFNDLTPEYARQVFKMDLEDGSVKDINARLIDVAAPFGKGQRGLIVSPPRGGKTMTLQLMANSITKNHPECSIFILLIGERPEEVTEMKRATPKAEVFASTFDAHASKHIKLSEMLISRAKRLVELNKDVVILLDSITRLARAYNTVSPSSGKVLSGGLDSQALTKPKRFFGAARNTQEAGSLTIIATALVDTGSTMDTVIFEEFKGTGNMELCLSRQLSDKRVYPSINFLKSGTRRDDLLFDPSELRKRHLLSRIMVDMDSVEVLNALSKKMSKTKNNKLFFEKIDNSL